MSGPEQSSSRAATKPRRVLACVLCQQRKVKCNRKFPCANCIKAGAQCVPAALVPRQRRRRYPERELLDRLRHYEDLLRENNIEFEPLHSPDPEKASPSAYSRSYDSPEAGSSGERKVSVKSETVNFWHAMNQTPRHPEDGDDNEDEEDNDSDVLPDDIREAWDQLYQSNDHLLFGLSKTNVDLSSLHPDQAQMFRLWQIYLENVNPLLKITHTPTLQSRFVNAASDVTSIEPNLEALMFSIYCVSILSLDDDQCRTLFGSPKRDLLKSYHFGCQQALLNCEVLRSDDRDCLTAFFLYLVAVKLDTDPRCLSSMLGVAIRIAQRMGIHNEASYIKCSALEAEMRRRLWWALVLFDTRISEISDLSTAPLVPTWDCKTPLNVNDFDLQPEMTTLPVTHGESKSTEALFAVVRSELGEFVRHSAFHLDFINPMLKAVAKDVQHGPVPEGGELVALEKMMEEKYLKFCNPENPFHFMTLWTARSYLAKNRLLEHYSRSSKIPVQQVEAERDAAFSHALGMLECDTKLMTSPLIKGYLWLVNLQFPFPGYIYLVQELRRRPVGEHAEKAWEIMSDNYDARFEDLKLDYNPFFKIFARMILHAWAARVAVSGQLDEQGLSPRIVSRIKDKLAVMAPNAPNVNIEQPNEAMGMNSDNFSMPMPMDFSGPGQMYGFGGQGFGDLGLGAFTKMPGQVSAEVDVNQLDLTALDWNPMHGYGW